MKTFIFKETGELVYFGNRDRWANCLEARVAIANNTGYFANGEKLVIVDFDKNTTIIVMLQLQMCVIDLEAN